MPVSYIQSKTALGSTVTLLMVTKKQKAETDKIFAQLWRAIFQFERSFSRFLPNSELSQFNQSAGIKKPISPEFQALLQESRRLSAQTKGLFNPFILPALQRAGYTQSTVPGYEMDAQYDYTKLHVAEANYLEVGDDWARIPYGTAIDLGGIGKGYLAGQLAEMINRDITGYWFSLGGDIVGGGRDEHDKPWVVEIHDSPDNADESAWEVRPSLEKFAVATSGTNIRKGAHKGRAWHHILDPRTQLPAETDLKLATVYGKSSTEADVLASAALILGSKKAPDFLKSFASVKGFLLQGVSEDAMAIEVADGKSIHAKQTTAGVGHVE